MPVKVGGGPAKQREYLDALRDAQGNTISYDRRGSCCGYESKNGLLGLALVDKYEVTYRDADNKKQKIFIYISFMITRSRKAVKAFILTKDL